jgi:lysophospholipase L1-like esterase
MMKKLLLLSSSILLSLLVLELASRLLFGTQLPEPRRVVLGEAERRWCCIGENDLKTKTYRPGIEFKHCYDGPGAGRLEEDDCVAYQINDWGYRDLERQRDKPARTRRVLVFGDSFSFGEGVRFEETWHRLLATSLAAREGGGSERVEVVNLAVAGDGSADQLARYRRFGRKLKPDLVILQWNTNDFAVSGIVQEHARLIGARYRDLYDDSPRYRWSALVHTLWYRLAMREISSGLLRLNEQELAGGRALFEKLGRLRDEVARDGGEFLILIFPELIHFDDYPYAGIVQALRDFAREKGIAYVDLLPELSRHAASELWVHETDHHPNYVAHEIAHRAVLEHLAAWGAPDQLSSGVRTKAR